MLCYCNQLIQKDWLRSILKDYEDINLDDGFKSKSFHDGKVFSSSFALLDTLIHTIIPFRHSWV